MISTRVNNNMVGINFINQAVFLGNMAGPMPRPIPLKRFRLAGSAKRVSGYFFNEGIDLVKYFFVFLFPLQIVGKSGIVKTNHRLLCSSAYCIACSRVSNVIRFSPRLTFSIAWEILLRFSGHCIRYSVASISSSSSTSFMDVSASRTVISMSRSRYTLWMEATKLAVRSFAFNLYVVSIQHSIPQKNT